MLATNYYKTKKELKADIGNPLNYYETSFFGAEFKPDGVNYITNHPKRSWFAQVFCANGRIVKVK